MNLHPSPDPDLAAQGLWVNADWQPGTPGTFAVVIGVSCYDHLRHGPGQPAAKHFGLPQLFVSAHTAHQIFAWLRDEYSYANCPLAQCWLLLSPGPEEKRFDPSLGTLAPAATFAACEAAIRGWFLTMKALPSPMAQQSRAFFFFCGHGFEVAGNQILLPADYMQPPLEHPDQAISTGNLLKGLAAIEVPSQLFFPDACRNGNDIDDLRRENVTGARILPESPTHRSNLARMAAIVYATAADTTAWQPNDPAVGPSLYGEALLEGVRAQGGFAPDCSADPCEVKVFPLQEHLDRRIRDLLRTKYDKVALQPVRLGGESGNVTVTQLPRLAPRPPTPVPDPSEPSSAKPPLIYHIDVPFTVRRELDAWHPFQVDDALRPGEEHDIFGSETMAALWESVRVYSLDRGEWLPFDNDVVLHGVQRDDSTRAFRLTFSVVGSGGDHWLQFEDLDRRFACLLPGDVGATPRYTLEMTREYQDNGPPRVSQLTAGLSLLNEEALHRAAALWERYTRANLGEALDAQFNRVAQGVGSSPLAATVIGLVLLRARRVDLLDTWLGDAAYPFAADPDVQVLRTEQLLTRTAQLPYPREVFTRLLAVRERGLPRTAEAFGYAVQQVSDVLRYGQPEADQEVQLLDLHDRLAAGSRFFRAGGLFSVFADSTGQLSVELAEGTGTAVAASV